MDDESKAMPEEPIGGALGAVEKTAPQLNLFKMVEKII